MVLNNVLVRCYYRCGRAGGCMIVECRLQNIYMNICQTGLLGRVLATCKSADNTPFIRFWLIINIIIARVIIAAEFKWPVIIVGETNAPTAMTDVVHQRQYNL